MFSAHLCCVIFKNYQYRALTCTHTHVHTHTHTNIHTSSNAHTYTELHTKGATTQNGTKVCHNCLLLIMNYLHNSINNTMVWGSVEISLYVRPRQEHGLWWFAYSKHWTQKANKQHKLEQNLHSQNEAASLHATLNDLHLLRARTADV